MKNYIDTLQKAEQHAGFLPHTTVITPYKIVGDVWIKANYSLIKTYQKTLKNSELPIFPDSGYKTWGVFILSKLKGKETKTNFKKLLGIGLNWRFLKKEYVPLQADILYYRTRAIVMVYTTERKVVKVALTKPGQRDMANETESQRTASAIAIPGISVSKIIKEFHDNGLDFTVEEYFIGKKQSFKDKKILEKNYAKVFDFMIEFYFKYPIELESLYDSRFLNHDFVDEFIQNQEEGETVFSIYKMLFAKERKIIKCRIHGDLNHRNVLSNGNQLCIIDWGQSKLNYLALELNNSSYNTKHVFEKFIERAEIEQKEIYSYEEQLFLARYIEMNRSIHNRIKRNKLTHQLPALVDKEIKKLLKMSLVFSKKTL